MAEVYWVHLPEHSDVLTQGYVGITTKTAGERFAQHLKDCNRSSTSHYHSYRAFRKYKESLVISTLVIAEEEYCREVEYKLRPESYIGWNMAPGGQRPIRDPESYGEAWKEKLRQHNLGKEHSEETLEKLSRLSKRCWSDPEYVEKMRDNISTMQVSWRTYDRFWNKGASSNPLIRRADEIIAEYEKDVRLFAWEILSLMRVEPTNANKLFVNRLLRRHRGGWSPLEDHLWLQDFRGVEPPVYCKFSAAWEKNDADGGNLHWLLADQAYNLFIEGFGRPLTTKNLGYTRSAFNVMFKNFENGWKPHEDPRWLSWIEDKNRNENAT